MLPSVFEERLLAAFPIVVSLSGVLLKTTDNKGMFIPPLALKNKYVNSSTCK